MWEIVGDGWVVRVDEINKIWGLSYYLIRFVSKVNLSGRLGGWVVLSGWWLSYYWILLYVIDGIF